MYKWLYQNIPVIVTWLLIFIIGYALWIGGNWSWGQWKLGPNNEVVIKVDSHYYTHYMNSGARVHLEDCPCNWKDPIDISQ